MKKLCFVNHKGNQAFFTSLPLKKQPGDGWHKKPWSCNASRPYDDMPIRTEVLFFELDCRTPSDDFSVDEINAKRVPWISTWDGALEIYAGTTIKAFKKAIKAAGGKIYVEEP